MIGSLDGADAYHAARDNAAWAAATPETRSGALERASDHIRTAYRLGPGTPAEVIEAATYQAALHEVVTPGLWSKVWTPDDMKILTQVGPLQWTPIAGGTLRGSSPLIDAMLAPYVQQTGWGVMVV